MYKHVSLQFYQKNILRIRRTTKSTVRAYGNELEPPRVFAINISWLQIPSERRSGQNHPTLNPRKFTCKRVKREREKKKKDGETGETEKGKK